ncbi:hypothetical protein D0B54_23725 [Solimonas sp. K1W22B-7]|uniref:hypothetical protein n=1 Tax=Solimonas sp. K1W22B-7 TaxID=2303331 RepID=UPI000E33061B|nr:hypothetical protein [Solimonas sp. K1W22B-7]AXQ31508.1 hypothetical protein D0B54_23725 [Solimonas sp. K1W22B-7]
MDITSFQSLKLSIMSVSGLDRDALHAYAGLGMLFASALVFRKSLRALLPWFMVAAMAVAVELLDFRDDMVTYGHLRWDYSAHDILNTLFWPTAILLLARRGILFGAARD